MSYEIRILDEGPGSHSFVDLSNQQLGFLGTSAVFVNRPGLSDRLIYRHLIPRVLEQNAAIILPLSTSSKIDYTIVTLGESSQIKILPNHIYQVERASQTDSAKTIAYLRESLRGRLENDATFPVVFIFDTLQKWNDRLEVQVRYLIQEASFLNFSVWIHAPIFLIPVDLLPTIGNVVVIWPSQKEVTLLAENLPGMDVEFWGETQSQGLFIYKKASGNGWQFVEFTPNMAKNM